MKIENTDSVSSCIFASTLLGSISILSLTAYVISWNLTFPEGYWTNTGNSPPNPGYFVMSALVVVPLSISFAVLNATFLVQIMNYLFDRTVCETCKKEVEKFNNN